MGARKNRRAHTLAIQLPAQPLQSPIGEDNDGLEECSATYQRLTRELLQTQRRELILLRDEGMIGDEAMRRIERDLDLEEARLEV